MKTHACRRRQPWRFSHWAQCACSPPVPPRGVRGTSGERVQQRLCTPLESYDKTSVLRRGIINSQHNLLTNSDIFRSSPPSCRTRELRCAGAHLQGFALAPVYARFESQPLAHRGASAVRPIPSRPAAFGRRGRWELKRITESHAPA